MMSEANRKVEEARGKKADYEEKKAKRLEAFDNFISQETTASIVTMMREVEVRVLSVVLAKQSNVQQVRPRQSWATSTG